METILLQSILDCLTEFFLGDSEDEVTTVEVTETVTDEANTI